jgi:hypothetical protein
MEKVQLDIKAVNFPGKPVTDAEKATIEFGLKIGQAIQYEWFRKDGNSCQYYSRDAEFNRRRLYARAEQPIQKYKNELAIDGDLSYLNLDWTPISITPKFVDLVVNGMADRVFKVRADSQDALSVKRKTEFQDVIQGEMLAKPILEKIEKDFGINPFVNDKETLPENDEELQLKMQLDYKPGIEIAEEIAITTILKSNHYDDLNTRFNYDSTVVGMAVGKHSFLDGGGIELKYIDPARVIHSYTEDPHFKDCFYWGDVETIGISELVRIDPKLTPEDLAEIQKVSTAWLNYYPEVASQSTLYNENTCTLLNFRYKTTKSFVYKKKNLDEGNSRVIPKDDTFNPPTEMMEEGKFERIEKRIEVWYEGIMVAGTNIMLKWELMENMVRPKSATQRAMPGYVAVAPRMYKGSIESLVSRMIPFADALQMNHMKLQQVSAKIVPDGVFIDADGLNEIDLGNGAAYNPEDALRLYFQTGSVIGRSFTQDGDFNNGRVPITQLNSSAAQTKIMSLISQYNHYLNQMKGAIGANDAMDASTPHQDALVGIQKLAALSSNVATRHILEASIYMRRTLSEGIAYMISDLLEYSEYKDELINQIGKHNVSILNDIKDLYLFDFAIFIDVAPDEEEKAFLEQNIQAALQDGGIDLEDAIDIREINNIKLANQLLKVKRKQRRDYMQKMKEQEQQMISQQQMQSQQMAAQIAAQKIQMEAQAKIQVKQAEGQSSIAVLEREAQLKSDLMNQEFNLNMKLKGVEVQVKQQLEDKKEQAKDERTRIQASQQSKLISQRQFDLPPMTFESNEDSMDGFDMAEFEPR